jgi:hypothetical protein
MWLRKGQSVEQTALINYMRSKANQWLAQYLEIPIRDGLSNKKTGLEQGAH